MKKFAELELPSGFSFDVRPGGIYPHMVPFEPTPGTRNEKARYLMSKPPYGGKSVCVYEPKANTT